MHRTAGVLIILSVALATIAGCSGGGRTTVSPPSGTASPSSSLTANAIPTPPPTAGASPLETLTSPTLLAEETAPPTSPPTAAATPEPQSAFSQFLRFVPDRPEYHQYLTFGDAAAWHASWGIPRIANKEQLDSLERDARAYWLNIWPRQANPPGFLLNYLFTDDQRGVYGFDLFNLDSYLVAGYPPDSITVAGFSVDPEQIASALTATGYQAEKLEQDGTLHRLNGDYQVDLDAPTKTGQLGDLNRIALLDDEMVVGKADSPVLAALAAYDDRIPSLADDPQYAALAQALDDPALASTGPLTGAIVMDDLETTLHESVVASLGSGATKQEVDERLAELSEGPQLPAYSLVAFATRHQEGATYLILALLLNKGADAQAAADLLADRLRNYVSAVDKRPLSEMWAERGAKVERATAVEAAGQPVALVLVRAEDPALTPPDQEQVNTNVPAWIEMVAGRDLGFLWR